MFARLGAEREERRPTSRGVQLVEVAQMDSMVVDPLTPLILDLLEWLAWKPRPYGEVMDAWRTSCPRLMIWEEVNDRGLITQRWADGHGLVVGLAPSGPVLLAQHGRLPTESGRS